MAALELVVVRLADELFPVEPDSSVATPSSAPQAEVMIDRFPSWKSFGIIRQVQPPHSRRCH